jgi:hypothetical protein
MLGVAEIKGSNAPPALPRFYAERLYISRRKISANSLIDRQLDTIGSTRSIITDIITVVFALYDSLICLLALFSSHEEKGVCEGGCLSSLLQYPLQFPRGP